MTLAKRSGFQTTILSRNAGSGKMANIAVNPPIIITKLLMIIKSKTYNSFNGCETI